MKYTHFYTISQSIRNECSIFAAKYIRKMTKLTLFFTIFISLFLAMLPHAIWFICWLIGKCFHYSLPYAPFGWTAVALVLCVWMLMGYGYWVGRWQTETNRVTVTSSTLPSTFDGYSIVHISDFHLSTFDGHPEHVQRLVDTINALQPDLICFTGDLVSIATEEARPYTDILKQLQAKDGVVSILGNHDFLIYNRSFADAAQQKEEVERLAAYQRDELHWTLLRNEHKVIRRGTDSLTVLGVDNIHGNGQGFSTIDYGNLSKAMTGTGGYRILLTHDPSHWEAEVLHHTDIPLALSGHTHSAQIRLFGWNPASWMFRQSWGKYTVDGQTIYVNAGLGCTLPVRLNCPSEITLITLQK